MPGSCKEDLSSVVKFRRIRTVAVQVVKHWTCFLLVELSEVCPSSLQCSEEPCPGNCPIGFTVGVQAIVLSHPKRVRELCPHSRLESLAVLILEIVQDRGVSVYQPIDAPALTYGHKSWMDT